MALTNYADLKSSIAAWLARSSLTSTIPDFITMAETTFNYGEVEPEFPPLRTRFQETVTDLTVTSGSVAVPSDFLDVIKVKAATSPTRNLAYATPEWLDESYPSGQDSTAPNFYTIIGSDIKCPTDFELTYYAKVPALSDSADTNWLMTRSPNAYLYTSLMHAYTYQQAYTKAANFRRLALSAVRGLERADMTSRAGTMAKRASGQTP